MELEQIALKDDYFVASKLYPNVDFYSGIILQAMGFPTSMFTVLFAVARTVGWIAQWNEMIEDPDQKIGRPRQLYTGQTERPYMPLHCALDSGVASGAYRSHALPAAPWHLGGRAEGAADAAGRADAAAPPTTMRRRPNVPARTLVICRRR